MLVLPVNQTVLSCFIVLTVPCPMTIFAFTLVLRISYLYLIINLNYMGTKPPENN